MKIKSFFPWDFLISIITIVFNALFIFCVWDAFRTGVLAFEIISLCIIIIPILFLPIRLIVTDQELRIIRLCGFVKIDVSDIKSCVIIKDSEDFFNNGVRRFGSGGMYGVLGYFKHDRLGKMRCFVTHREQCFLVRTKSNRCFVISSPKREEIIAFINQVVD